MQQNQTKNSSSEEFKNINQLFKLLERIRKTKVTIKNITSSIETNNTNIRVQERYKKCLKEDIRDIRNDKYLYIRCLKSAEDTWSERIEEAQGDLRMAREAKSKELTKGYNEKLKVFKEKKKKVTNAIKEAREESREDITRLKEEVVLVGYKIELEKAEVKKKKEKLKFFKKQLAMDIKESNLIKKVTPTYQQAIK